MDEAPIQIGPLNGEFEPMINDGQIEEEEKDITNLLDQIQELQNKNIELKKKCHKYKK